MFNVRTLFLLATAVSAGVIRRDTAEILADLEAIDSATNDLTATVVAWDGSILGALAIQSDTTAIGNLVDDATADAADEDVASSADSATVIDYINDTGEPDIAASLDALVARVADFEADGITSLVLTSLETLQGKNDDLAASLLAITAADQLDAAQAAVDKIDAAFDAAIAAFS